MFQTGKSRRIRLEQGFTLIELMVVILIIGLLATIVVQNLRSATDRAKRVKAQADIAQIKSGLDRYYLDAGSYPTTDQGLNALVSQPSTGNVPSDWQGPYLEKIPPDPWGHSYVYQSDGTDGYTLKSLGPHGVEGDGNIDGSTS
ncbi:MAG TPA: type II secretion system major pseudopilin GspG [Candidatus Binataceae bacterium]|jgi:general secretion pathway protein G|nr:type II secretion system major pseudopilin GspG [Candidatus Binataceae bacterium]